MQQFGNAHFAHPLTIPQRSTGRRTSVLDAALQELSLEAARHRLHVAQQRMHKREHERARQVRLHYEDALDWLEIIEGEATTTG
jgi:hypothetical protein